MTSQGSVLEFSEVTIKFGGVTAVNDVSFSVRQGDIHAVIGPNGAGKTTLFNALSGIVTIQSGNILLEGESITGLPSHAIASRGIGRTFQNLALCGEMSVQENLLLGRYVKGSVGWLATAFGLPIAVREGRAARKHVVEVAELLGVAPLLQRPASELNYGDRKRVELARALCMEPAVLLLDEPVAGMNQTETAIMTSTLLTLGKDFAVTVLLVEHDMAMVMECSDQITVINHGSVIADGPPQEIQRNPLVIDAYLGVDESSVHMARDEEEQA